MLVTGYAEMTLCYSTETHWMHVNKPANNCWRIFTPLKAELGINFIIQQGTLQSLLRGVFMTAKTLQQLASNHHKPCTHKANCQRI